MFLKAVVDQLVDGRYAILLAGEREDEYIAPIEQLPSGVVEGSIVEMEIKDGVIVQIHMLREETEESKQRIKAKMKLLRARGSKLKRKE